MESGKQEEIIFNLQKAHELHSEILSAAEKKRKGLVDLDLQSIREATSSEEDLVVLVKDNERERREILTGIAGESETDASRIVRLRDVLGLMDEAAKSRISLLRSELVRMANSIRRINKVNRLLAEQVLAHLHGFLALFAGSMVENRSYGLTGCHKANASASVPLVVDRRV